MNVKLNPVEVRILGSLIEKELTTPEYYPLTLNALTNACNQKSNREPVVSYDETTVARGLESLREKNLAIRSTGAGSRVPKYKHTLDRKFPLKQQEIAVLCVLFLRGPQTVGEIRGRTARMYEFKDLEEVDATLEGLLNQAYGPLVVELPRQPGRKENRYAHLFSGQPEIVEEAREPRLEATTQQVLEENERIAKLENELQAIKKELSELRKEFAEFKREFE